MAGKTWTWEYPARLVRVVDGDTVDLLMDLGLKLNSKQRIRLAGINAPEMRGEEREQGIAVKQAVMEWMGRYGMSAPGDPWPLRIKTYRDPDHWGRYIGYIESIEGGQSLNDYLVEQGHAVVVQYDNT